MIRKNRTSIIIASLVGKGYTRIVGEANMFSGTNVNGEPVTLSIVGSHARPRVAFNNSIDYFAVTNTNRLNSVLGSI